MFSFERKGNKSVKINSIPSETDPSVFFSSKHVGRWNKCPMPADIHLAIISAAISRTMKHIKSPNDALRTSFRYENLPTDYRPSAAWQSIFHDIIYTTHNSRKNGLKLRQFTFFSQLCTVYWAWLPKCFAQLIPLFWADWTKIVG